MHHIYNLVHGIFNTNNKMKTTKRFDDAVTKLYTAYHNNTLNAFNCQACAVGNIVGHGDWHGYRVKRNKDYVIQLPVLSTMPCYPNNASYNAEELRKIEYTFMSAWVGTEEIGLHKENQYKGLIAVVELLAEFDNIPNPFNLENLFSNDKAIAKKELQLIK